jgi:hypothetical protein
MDKLKEMFERLPKWAKIGLPILAAVLIVYVIYKNKGTSSGTLTEATVGSADTGGSSSGSAPDAGLPSTVPVGSVVPPAVHHPSKASAVELAYAAHWAEQARKNASKLGVKTPVTSKTNANMTEAQVRRDAAYNKGIAEGLAAKAHYHAPAKVPTKSRTVAVSHVAAKGSNKESPKKGAPVVHKMIPGAKK